MSKNSFPALSADSHINLTLTLACCLMLGVFGWGVTYRSLTASVETVDAKVQALEKTSDLKIEAIRSTMQDVAKAQESNNAKADRTNELLLKMYIEQKKDH